MIDIVSSNQRFPWLGGAAAVLLTLALAGCGRNNQVKVYKLVNDSSNQPSSPANAGAQNGGSNSKLTWSLPSGWKERPATGMRVASFTAMGPAGQTADVSVIPMPGGESELALVNMWRQQLQLPTISVEGPGSEPEPVTIGSGTGKLFDMVSEKPIVNNQDRGRILVAMRTVGGTSWFFKMTGEDAFVQKERPVFLQFLKSVAIPANGHPKQFTAADQFQSTNAKETPSADLEKPIWIVPPDWKKMPASQFLLAKFEVSSSGGAKADVNVSMLDGTGGGVLANVNRWRGQVGLAPVSDADLGNLMQSVAIPGGKALFVDMTGKNASTGQPERLVAAIIPQSGQTWFYKLMGNAKLVAQQKSAFVQFVKTVKYRNVP